MSKKLHLGCGQNYFEGYINIDFPLDKHSVQQTSVADEFADITKLRYPTGSIDEVRLHHVFEHFTRPVACALVASWQTWLKTDGVLHIEVPDFDRTAKSVLSRFTDDHTKAVGLRHIFGSNEEFWAVHYEGWSAKRLGALVTAFGFEVNEIKTNEWKGTYNFELIAKKVEAITKADDLESRARKYLQLFLLDDSEANLLDIWMNYYRQQAALTRGK